MPCPGLGPGLGHSLPTNTPTAPLPSLGGAPPTEDTFVARVQPDDFNTRVSQRRDACPAGCPGPGPPQGPELGLRFASYRYHAPQSGQSAQNGQGATTPEYYMPPPSPAPSNDRFVPPPPLSPPPTPSPDCYPSNPFPSPTSNAPTTTFIPPPPLSPSPTENKYEKFQQKYSEKYGEKFEKFSPKQDRFSTTRLSYHSENSRYTPERNYPCYATTERYNTQNYHSNERYSSSERYLPPTAHTPVERYVPQPQEYYQYQTYERYPKWNNNNSGDPYMRRDLGYHHHYRLPVPFQHQYHRIRYLSTPRKCCSLDYNLSKSSPGSTSSSSSSSHQQSELLSCYHVASPSMRTAQAQTKMATCKHMCSSPSVEYVGASGGRHVCATPPPARTQGEICSGECCVRRSSQMHAATIWRPPSHHPSPQSNPSPTPVQQPLDPPPPDPHPHSIHQSQHQQQIPQIQTHQSNINPHSSQIPSHQSHAVPPLQQISTHQSTHVPPLQTHVGGAEPQQQQKPTNQHPPAVQRAISLPTERHYQRESVQPIRQRLEYSQSERIANRERPKFARSGSRKEAVKNFIKKETANFFGVDEETEVDQQLRWLDRRKRLASRTYGPLKDEYTPRSRYTTLSYSSGAQRGTSSHMGPSQRGETLSYQQDSAPPPYPGEMPDVLPPGADVGDATSSATVERRHTVRRKDSVARMTWDGISYVVNTLTKHRPRPRSQVRQWSRSYPPEDLPSEILEDDVFFERPTTPTSPGAQETGDAPDAPLDPRPPPQRYSSRSGAPGWKRDTITQRRDQQRPEVGGTRIWSAMLDTVLDNSDRRQYGMGWVGKMFGRSMRSSVAQEDQIKQQLDDLEDYRPLFTYWVTTVQVLVLAISLICYGFGPFGIDLYQRSGQVLVTSLSLQQVEYMEPANFWFGPRAADLIHLGAKFAPCMRVDDKIMKEIEKMREKERETACCIRNDDSGCVQSSQADCSKTISTWKKWSAGDSGPGGRISGSVCGLDPKFCDAPASVHPYEWPDDITKWPICRKTNSFTQRRGGSNGARPGTSVGTSARDKLAEHMVCEIIGHPCCIGIHGQCRITTREYCDFVRGHFHEEASLCAQVSCLDNVCGMVPFYFMETPDQFYRLWTSLFLHAGVLQLLVTVLIQHFLMRDLEKLTGPFRIGIIYIGSGVAGNLASSIFVPYRADVGPSGAQFGLLACLIVEVLNSWPMLKHPHYALFKLLSITFVLLLFGLLPWVDNYSHIFGFIFGFLLSYAFLPFVSFGPYDRQRKIVLIWVCLTSAGILFVCLILLFYIIPVYDCEVCTYLNCLPLTKDFCATQNINFMKEEPVV